LQLLAMVTMLIDHVGKAFYPDQIKWQVIGRFAFPIYAYCIVLGYRHSKNIKNYMLRLLIIAMVSQYPYMLVFDTMDLNVVGSLLIALIVLVALDRYKGLLRALVIVGIAGLMLEGFNFSYGVYGLLLVLVYRYSRKHSLVPLHFILNLIFMYLKGWFIGMFNILPTILIVYLPLFYEFIDKIRIPRWLWRSFYPAHLVVLALLLMLT
jgi:hypothetical protein